MMKRLMMLVLPGILLCVALSLAQIPKGTNSAVQLTPSGDLPAFQVDPSWPKKLPNNWVFGPVSGLTVDGQDHIWVITRPNEKWRPEQRTQPVAPPVLEFDATGNFIQGWGGPGQGYDWPTIEHGITVDPKGFVWIAGRGSKDHQILKFTKTGKFVLQIGHAGASKGNADTANFNMPADVTVYAKTNEIFVAD